MAVKLSHEVSLVLGPPGGQGAVTPSSRQGASSLIATTPSARIYPDCRCEGLATAIRALFANHVRLPSAIAGTALGNETRR